MDSLNFGSEGRGGVSVVRLPVFNRVHDVYHPGRGIDHKAIDPFSDGGRVRKLQNPYAESATETRFIL